MMTNTYLEKKKNKRILTACIGQCVHVAGTYNFIQISKQLGYNNLFLGPATPISIVIDQIKKYDPNIVGLSYRLTADTVRPLLNEFFKSFIKLEKKPKKLFFAGTPEVVEIARKYEGIDEYFVGGESKFELISILRNEKEKSESKTEIPMDIISRIQWKKPYPVIRAHFGLPNFNETIEGIKKIAKAKKY
ncbi:MAG: hypothetical protein LN408_05635 [Candidatus Thermoplasmatota archaeon]|nr:hypothetical protein [Candidatus Thermoplasmatota archaeon]